MVQLQKTNLFKKNLKAMIKRGKDPQKIFEVISTILENSNKNISYNLMLPKKYKLHKLSGKYKNLWDCHIEPDWILLYYLDEDTLRLENTGTHSDLFK